MILYREQVSFILKEPSLEENSINLMTVLEPLARR